LLGQYQLRFYGAFFVPCNSANFICGKPSLLHAATLMALHAVTLKTASRKVISLYLILIFCAKGRVVTVLLLLSLPRFCKEKGQGKRRFRFLLTSFLRFETDGM